MAENKNVYINSLYASDIYQHQRGKPIRSNFVGMVPYSLELIKLRKFGLKVYEDRNGKLRSNDIINVRFKTKVPDYKEILKDNYIELIKEILDNLREKSKEMRTKSQQKKNDFAIAELFKLLSYLELVERMEYDGVNVRELREELYNLSFVYNGIEYMVYKRTSAKSRTGQCQFIKKNLRDKAIKWARMGMNLEGLSLKDGVDFPSLLAYETLVSSSIIGTIKIHPDNIFIIDDVISKFTTKASVITNSDNSNRLISISEDNHDMESDIFDGESILDEMYFKNKKGSKLVRMHMFKSCIFKGRVQKFLIDHCPKDILFEDWKLKDMFGNEVYAKDIHMITTPNSVKALKFYKRKKTKKSMYEHWKKKIIEDDCIFGVCKHEKPSNKGYSDSGKILNQTSYQMLNSMPFSREEIIEISKYEIEFLKKLKNNDEFYLNHLIGNANEINANELLYNISVVNPDFMNTDIFKNKRRADIAAHKNKIKRGKIRLEGDYVTICQNPKEMLYHAIGKLPVISGILQYDQWENNMELIKNQCHTPLHEFGEEYTCFRNPHTAPSNVLVLENKESSFISKYMCPSDNIIYTNAIDFEINRILSGQDVDSDSLLMFKGLLEIAKRCFGQYNVCDNMVDAMKMDYSVSTANMARIDNILSSSQGNIGEVVNLGQFCMSCYWEEINLRGNTKRSEELLKAVDICTILSEIAIDMAKKMYNVDFKSQVREISKILNSNEKPLFFKYISKNKNARTRFFNTPMDYLNEYIGNMERSKWNKDIDMLKIIKKHTFKVTKKNKRQRERFNEIINGYISTRRAIYLKPRDGDKREIRDEIKKEIQYAILDCSREMKKYKASASTMFYTITGLLSGEIETKEILSYMNILYKMNEEVFLSLFKK